MYGHWKKHFLHFLFIPTADVARNLDINQRGDPRGFVVPLTKPKPSYSTARANSGQIPCEIFSKI
jgi:hypothetical protein